jgi:leucyl-tRNA synthetase
VVQVNGKLRAEIIVPADADQDAIRQAALSDGKIAQMVEGKTVAKVIIVPGRLVNVVLR